MKEYTTAKGWVIFTYITFPLLIILFVWMLIMPLVLDNTSEIMIYILSPISLGVSMVLIICFLDVIKGKIRVSEKMIQKKMTLINQTLMQDEIKGFRVNSDSIFIVPKSANKKKIKIGRIIGKEKELIHWLIEHYPNLTTK